MKKILSLILIVAMVFNIAGCGKKEVATGDVVELTVWGHQEDSWNQTYVKVADQFMKENPNIKINFEFFPYDQFESKVQTSIISKEGGADIYELWGGWGIDYAPTGALKALPDEMANEILADSYAPTTGALVYDGKLYGLPLEFNIESGGMLVNCDVLRENGFEVPTTWDEMVKQGEKAAKWDGDICMVKGFDFVNWDSVSYLLLSMILGQGGQYLGDDGKTVTLNTPEGCKAFDELKDLVVVKKVTDLEGLVGGGDIEGYQQLYAGGAMIVPRGPWTVPEGIDYFGLELGKGFDYVACPWYAGTPKFAAETGWSIAINNSTTHAEACDKFLEFMYRDDVMEQINLGCSTIPPKKSVAQDSKYLDEMTFAKPLVDILDEAQFIGYFNSDQFKEAVNDAFVDYCMGEYSSADKALAAASDTINGAQ